MSTDKDRTLVVTEIGDHITVDRRRSDGMAWLSFGDPSESGSFKAVVPLDADEAWSVAQALLAPHAMGVDHDQ